MQTVNPAILNKFCGLITYLARAKSEFEMIADEIEDRNLRTALNNLSQESDQYINTLNTQLQHLGIHYEYKEDHFTPEGANTIYNIPASGVHGEEVSYICHHNESFITKAYRDILSDLFSFDTLKKTLRFQLNALKYAFMKIRLLNAARFSN